MAEFKINEYLTLKLEGYETNIYVNGKFFRQCKYLLLEIPTEVLEDYEEIDSIDEAAETLDHSLEGQDVYKYDIPPETEFWGHCSNMQAWAENNYDTRILHRNLAFVLLKELTQAGDPVARAVFKEEIAKRLESRHPTVIKFLILEGYVPLLNEYELESLFETPSKWLIESFIELLHNEFLAYLEALRSQGRKIQFLKKNEQAIPVMTTVKKLVKFRNPKLIEGIFMGSDIYSLIYLYLEQGFNDYYIQNDLDFRERITNILISGLEHKDKYIFGFSLEALVFYSYIRFTKWHRRSMDYQEYKRKGGIRVKNHLSEENYEEFVYNVAENLLKFYDSELFNYKLHLVAYSVFFADFGNPARKGLDLLRTQGIAELKEIADKSLLIIEVEFSEEDKNRREISQKIEIETLKNLNVKEINVLIPEDTGKILVESIVYQLSREKSNRTLFGNAMGICRYVGEFHAIELGEGVFSILRQYNVELLDIIFALRLFEYLTTEECVFIANNINLTLTMKNAFTAIANKIEYDHTKNKFASNVPFMDWYPYYIENLCVFLRNLKGKLNPQKIQHFLTFLENSFLEGLPSPQFWNLVLKLHITEPSVEDVVFFYKWYRVEGESGLDRRKWDAVEEISKCSNIPEAGLEAILTEKDMFAFRNAIGSELLKKMGPSRLIPLFKNPSLNFSSSVLQILPVFKNKQYREGYIKFLKEIEDLSSIPIITETDYEDKQKMREILAEKDQLKHLDREKFWNLFPKEILRLREIEDISHYSFSYMSHKYVKSLTSGTSLSFSLKDDQLIFFSGAYCKLKDEQVRKIFDIIVDFPLIIRLCLNHNNFQTLPEEIGLFKNLEAIGLAYAGITSLPDSIGELTSLEQLEINYNHLTELPNSIGNLTSLKKLYINSINQITQLPNSIGNLKSLENLSLSWNPLTSLPDTIGNLIHLSRLSIEACPLKTLPESIGNLTSLAYLHMAETKIETLPISMKNLKNLKFIQVSNHLLHDMPKLRALMKPLKNLEVRIGFESLLMGNLMSNEIF